MPWRSRREDWGGRRACRRSRGTKGKRLLLRYDLFVALLQRLHVFSVELERVDCGPQPAGGIDVHLLENGRPAVDDDLGADSAAHRLSGDDRWGGRPAGHW